MIEVTTLSYHVQSPPEDQYGLRVEFWRDSEVWVVTYNLNGNYLRRDTFTFWNGFDGGGCVETLCGFSDRQEALAAAVAFLQNHLDPNR